MIMSLWSLPILQGCEYVQGAEDWPIAGAPQHRKLEAGLCLLGRENISYQSFLLGDLKDLQRPL